MLVGEFIENSLDRYFLFLATLLNLILTCYIRLWYYYGLTSFMLPVLPHPLAAGPGYPFSASLGSCASSINSKFDTRSLHRLAESASLLDFRAKTLWNPKLILRSSTMAQHPMYGNPATTPLVYQQRYCLAVVHSIANSSQAVIDKN